jgi:hypothetical protein
LRENKTLKTKRKEHKNKSMASYELRCVHYSPGTQLEVTVEEGATFGQTWRFWSDYGTKHEPCNTPGLSTFYEEQS